MRVIRLITTSYYLREDRREKMTEMSPVTSSIVTKRAEYSDYRSIARTVGIASSRIEEFRNLSGKYYQVSLVQAKVSHEVPVKYLSSIIREV